MSIPEQLRYSNALKNVGLRARVSRRQYFPESTTTFTTSSRVIRIPIQSPDAMVNTNNSWLRATVNVAAATADVYMRSGYSLFQRVRILSAGGAVLDEIEQYGQIMNALCDAYLDGNTRSKQGTAAGFAQAGDTASAAFTVANLLNFPSGATTTRNLCIPIIGTGLLSLTSGEQNDGHGLLLPLPLMNGIILELTLRDNPVDMVFSAGAATGVSVSLTNVCFDAECITYDQSVIQSLKDSVASAGGKIYLSGSSYHGQVLSASSAMPQISINERVRSLKSLYLINQLAEQVNQIRADYDARVPLNAGGAESNAGEVSFSILIGSQKYPAQELQYEPTEHMAALSSAGGKPLAGIISRSSFISLQGTSAANPFDSGDAVGCALFGLNLETADARAMVESGFDVASGSLPITVQAKFSAAPATSRNHTVATHYDAVYLIDVLTKDVQVSY